MTSSKPFHTPTKAFPPIARALFFTALFILFALKGVMVLDPDFGWHLKMGEHIIKSGIPRTDPFSYTMPSYPFVDHEWLVDIVTFLLYRRIGIAGLATIFSLIAVFTLIIILRSRKGWSGVLAGLAAACILLPFAGVRPQVISWFFTALFFQILTRKGARLTVLVPLMWLWVNLHGGFFVGVIMIAVYTLISLLKNKTTRLVFTLLGPAVLVTLINPYRERIWWEVFMSLSDSSLRFFVSEWMPAIAFLSLVFWSYCIFACSAVIKFGRRIPLFNGVIFWTFLLAALSSMRNIPLWLVVSIPCVGMAMDEFARVVSSSRGASERFGRARRIFYITAFSMVVLQLVALGQSILAIDPYPEKAVRFFREKKLEGRIISLYGWGGYLIWKLPGEKVFIDGRMPSWRRKEAPPGESRDARKEYGQFFENTTLMKKTGERYNIRYVLIPSPGRRSTGDGWVSFLLPQKNREKNPALTLPVLYDDGIATIRILKQ